MGNLKTANTSYPGTLDTATALTNGENSDAQHINGPVSAIIALETELGTDVSGSRATLKERLQSIVDAAGGLLKGSDFPVSPEAVPHLFWHTVSLKLYVYNISTAQYVQIPVTTDLAGYLTTNTPATITARHTFSTSTVGAPFTVSGSSINQKVTGLNADAVDGHDLNQDVSTTSSPTFVTATTTTSVATDTITERTAAAGVTIDSVLLKDNGVTATTVTGTTVTGNTSVVTDTIAEKTATAGVTVDGCLIKDGVVAKATNLNKNGYVNTTYSSGDVTVTTNTALTAAIDLGTVTAGDLIHVSGQARFVKGSPAGESTIAIAKSTGTGACREGAYYRISQAASATDMLVVNAVLEVTTPGTLTLYLLGTSAGSNATASNNYSFLSAFYIYKQ